LRARRTTEDEIGQLTRALNEMLDRIERQAGELRASHAERAVLLENERSAREEAERASRSKDEFVATLSHELRTPLTPIVGWLEILRRVSPEDPALLAQGLEVIERNARVQTQMIDDLLDMSRIVSGKLRLDVGTVHLREIVEAALVTLGPAAEARGIELRAALDPRARAIRGDPNRLQQVVWNLLSNAIKFTDKGGRVEIAVRDTGSRVEIVVRDTGQGISAEFLPHVFDRFRQADASTARRHGGLGLGLAIVRQLVELHGGSVRAESAGRDQGATFTVELPVSPVAHEEVAVELGPPGPVRAPAAEEPAASLAGSRLLVVDDEADTRELLARVFRDRGAEVRVAGSAAEGLAALGEFRPAVLVSDIGMPGTDGYELIRHVRELGDAAGGATPAIALTAFARSEDRTRALRAGYQLHLAKPVSTAELIAAVDSLRHLRAVRVARDADGSPVAG
jgi:signal transduction histidine kinase/CheY-like chemotaxis protein